MNLNELFYGAVFFGAMILGFYWDFSDCINKITCN